MQNILALSGLVLSLIGAGLLFVYSLPKKKMGNVFVYGELELTFDDQSGKSRPMSEWLPKAQAFQRRAKILNSTGFGLLALGTLLQMVSVLCAAAA